MIKGICVIIIVFFVMALVLSYKRYKNNEDESEGNGWLAMLLLLEVACVGLFFLLVSFFEMFRHQ